MCTHIPRLTGSSPKTAQLMFSLHLPCWFDIVMGVSPSGGPSESGHDADSPGTGTRGKVGKGSS